MDLGPLHHTIRLQRSTHDFVALRIERRGVAAEHPVRGQAPGGAAVGTNRRCLRVGYAIQPSSRCLSPFRYRRYDEPRHVAESLSTRPISRLSPLPNLSLRRANRRGNPGEGATTAAARPPFSPAIPNIGFPPHRHPRADSMTCVPGLKSLTHSAPKQLEPYGEMVFHACLADEVRFRTDRAPHAFTCDRRPMQGAKTG